MIIPKVDYERLMGMTVTDRAQELGQKWGDSFLSMLTPTEFAAMFPDYYKDDLPDIGLTSATSGVTPIQGSAVSYNEPVVPVPPRRGQTASSMPQLPSSTTSTTAPRKPVDWKAKIDQAYAKATGKPSSAVVKGDTQTLDAARFRQSMVEKVRMSSLNGVVPKDGAKYGIKNGTPQEWANYFTGLAKHESGLNVKTKGDVGIFDGDSNGLFQLSPNDALTYKIQKEPFTQEQLRDPDFNTNVALKIHEHWIVDKQKGILDGAGKYWGPISQEGWTPGAGRDSDLPWEQWRKEDATAVPVDQENKTGSLTPNTDKDGKAILGPSSEGIPNAEYKLPSETPDGVSEYYHSLPDDKKSEFQDKVKVLGMDKISKAYDEWQKSNSKRATASPYRESSDQFGLSGTAAARGLSQVDERLTRSIEEAAKDFPLRVRLFSGKRDSGAHGRGLASDVQLFDDNGSPISSYQTPQTANIYAMWAEKVKQKQEELYPELNDEMAWGGAFSGMKKGGGGGVYGAADLMDIRVGKWNGISPKTMPAYKYGQGWQKGYEYYAEGDFLGIGAKKGPFTEEDYEKLKGFKLTDEQLAIQRHIAIKGQFNAGLLGHPNIGPREPLKESSKVDTGAPNKTGSLTPNINKDGKASLGPTKPAIEENPVSNRAMTGGHPLAKKKTETVAEEPPKKEEPSKKEVWKPPNRAAVALEARKSVEQTAQPEKVPVKAAGGEVSAKGSDEIRVLPIGETKGDNSVVVNKEDQPIATMNTKAESMSYDKRSGNVSITPKHRVDPAEIEKTVEKTRKKTQDEAEDNKQAHAAPAGGRQTATKNNTTINDSKKVWSDELTRASQQVKSTESFKRFVKRTKDFSESGNHYNGGSSIESK